MRAGNPGRLRRKRARAMQWDAQIERGGELYYRTLSLLARRRTDRRAFATFAQLEGANARALREEIRRGGGRPRPNPALLYAGVASGAIVSFVPRRWLCAATARLLEAGPAYWNERKRLYGADGARLVKRIVEHHDLQRDWFAEQLAAERRGRR